MMHYCYFGHHKAATTFISQSVVQEVCRSIGMRWSLVNKPADFDYNLTKHLRNNRIDFLNYVNADDALVQKIDIPFVGFHVIRDPRDVIVSAYYSHRNSHSVKGWPELFDHRAKLRNENLEDGLLRELEFTLDLITDGTLLHPLTSMSNWDYTRDNILELRYEDMVGRSKDFFIEVFDFLDLVKSRRFELSSKIVNRLLPGQHRKLPCIQKSKLLPILDKISFSSVAGGRHLGAEDNQSHYRKGIPGEWKAQFTDKVKARFKHVYPGLVSHLGYEIDEDW